MKMKRITGFVLLMAGILLSLTGCQKGNEIDKSGNAVRFGVSTGVSTRTAYSGDGRKDSNGKLVWERIDWVSGEEIMIWSDAAVIDADAAPIFEGNQNLAVYKIGTVNPSDEKSYATIEDPLGNGLQYKDRTSEHKFWGFYPAKAVKASPAGNSIPLVIDGAQTLAANTHTSEIANDYVPSMDQAYMVAYKSGATASDATVDLEFNPAFTAFEFVIKSNKSDNLTIKSVELVSETSALSGEFTATCSNGTWTYSNGAADKVSKSVKATLPNGLTINNENSLILDVFALPQELTGMKVIFDTVEEGTKALKLTATAGGSEYISFAPCKKHVITGLILPGGWYFKYITLDLKVLEWEAVPVEGDSEDFPQATQFSVTGNGEEDVIKNGWEDLGQGDQNDRNDPYRQKWYFKPGQTVKVTFKVMLPAGGSWEVEPVGGQEGALVPADAALFTIVNNSPDAASTSDLFGPMKNQGSTDVELLITYNGTDTAQHSFFFHTYVYTGANKTGTKFNIDSETQIYDRGRGYHTFIVNSPLYK